MDFGSLCRSLERDSCEIHQKLIQHESTGASISLYSVLMYEVPISSAGGKCMCCMSVEVCIVFVVIKFQLLRLS